MNYTKGEWLPCGKERGLCSCGQIWSKEKDFHIITCETSNESGEVSNEEMKANVLLICAAPELLEAMIEFCERVERGEVRSKKTYAKFKSLITKATTL